MIKKRQLGRTGLQVSKLGFGAWAIGGLSYGVVKESDAVATVEAYLEAGGNLIDTARGYGESEKWIGKVVAGGVKRDDLVIISKTGNTETKEQVPAMRRDVETSLEELKTDFIDVLMIHNPPADRGTMELVIGEMKKMKEQGLVRFIGASIKGPSVTAETVTMCRQYMEQKDMDVFEVIYSMLRQKLDQEGILRSCHAQGIGLVIRTVLESGFLTGKYRIGHRLPENDHRSRWSHEVLDRILHAASDLQKWIPEGTPNLALFSLQFALMNPHLSTVIVGAKTPKQLMDNLKAASLPPLPHKLLQQLIEFGRDRTELYNI